MSNEKTTGMPSPQMSDTRTDNFWNNVDYNLYRDTPEPKDLSVGLGDAVKAAGAGALDLVGGIGEAARQASVFGKKNAGGNTELSYADQASARMANRLSPVLDTVAALGGKAQEGSTALVDSMSDDAKEAMHRSIVTENDKGALALGDGAGDIDVWAMKFANGLGSMLPTMMAGGITGIAAKQTLGRAVTASMVKRGASQEVAEAVAAKAVEKIAAGSAGATAITGSVGSAGLNAKETVNSMTFDELKGSSSFREAFMRIDGDQQYQGLSDLDKLSMARDEVANLASAATMGDVKTWGAAAVGSLMGDVTLFKMLAGKGAKGVVASTAKGAAGEGLGEMLEEGTQQYAVNQAVSETTGIESDPWKGVASSAIEGGLIGAGTGGAMGAASGARAALADRKAKAGEADQNQDDAPEQNEAATQEQDPLQTATDATDQSSVDGDPLAQMDGAQPDVAGVAPDLTNSGKATPETGDSVTDTFGFDEFADVPAFLRNSPDRDKFANTDAQAQAFRDQFDPEREQGKARGTLDKRELRHPTDNSEMGVSGGQFDEFRDMPASRIRGVPDENTATQQVLAEKKATESPEGWHPNVRKALAGEYGSDVRDMIAAQIKAGNQGATQAEQAARKPFDNKVDRELNQVAVYKPIEGEVIPAGTDKPSTTQAALPPSDLKADYTEIIPESHRIGKSDVIYASGEVSPDAEGNSAYVPPVLARNQPDTSMDTQSTRDPRSDVAKAIVRAGEATDSVFGPLKTMRITRRQKPFSSEKEAQLASRKDEMPVKLNGTGYGVAKIEEVEQAKSEWQADMAQEGEAENQSNMPVVSAAEGSVLRELNEKENTRDTDQVERASPAPIEEEEATTSGATVELDKVREIIHQQLKYNEENSGKRKLTGVRQEYIKAGLKAADLNTAVQQAGVESLNDLETLIKNSSPNKPLTTTQGKEQHDNEPTQEEATPLKVTTQSATQDSQTQKDNAAVKPSVNHAAVLRLRKRGESLQTKGQNDLDAPRQDNTHRRLTMAESARNKARREIELGKQISAVADGLEAGTLKALSGITDGKQVEALSADISASKYKIPESIRQQYEREAVLDKDYNSRYSWTDSATPEHRTTHIADLHEFYADLLKEVAGVMQKTRGYKQMGVKLRSMVNAIGDNQRYLRITDKDMLEAIGKITAQTNSLKSSSIAGVLERIKRYERAGITTTEQLKAAAKELIIISEQDKDQAAPSSPLPKMMTELKRKLVNNRNSFIDFFPTPEALAQRMVDEAGIGEGMRVLEPSAGHGAIADAIKDAGGKVDAVELANDLAEILTAKGHNVIGRDFLETVANGEYDAVLMNPPFSNDMDIDHVMHAYEHLKPGGTLVAIVSSMAGERSNKKNKAFAEFLMTHDAERKILPANSFSKSMNPTNVSTAMITLTKEDNEASVNDGRTGRRVTSFTPKGKEVEVQYKAVEASNLLTSHDFSGQVNPEYPQQLQPRDRSRDSYQLQVRRIASGPEFERLSASPETDRGAPIIGNGLSNVVESGNGRTIALKQAYKEGKAGDYKRKLIEHAQEYGLSAEAISAMREPVLVRERITSMDVEQLKQFVVDSNIDAKMATSATEQAKADASLITAQMMGQLNIPDGGNLLAASNMGFLTEFAKAIGLDNMNKYISSDGRYNNEYKARVANAIFAYGYDSDTLLRAVTGDTDEAGVKISNALMNNAAKMAELRELRPEHAAEIANYITEAVVTMSDARRNSQSIAEVLAQGDMLSGGVSQQAKAMAETLHEMQKSAVKMTAFLGEILNTLNINAQQNNPNQPDIFGGKGKIDKTPGDAINEAIDSRERPASEQRAELQPGADLFGASTARNDTAPTASVHGSDVRSEEISQRAAPRLTPKEPPQPTSTTSPADDITVNGVGIRLPRVNPEQEKTYNQATYRGQGRNFANEVSVSAGRILADLDAKGLLETATQKELAGKLVQQWAEREAENYKRIMAYGIANPSWFITGREGKKASKGEEQERKRLIDHQEQQAKAIQQMTSALTRLMPAEKLQAKQLKEQFNQFKDYFRELYPSLKSGYTALLQSQRKAFNPKIDKLIDDMLNLNREEATQLLRDMNTRVVQVSEHNLIDAVGRLSKPGKKLTAILQTEPTKSAAVKDIETARIEVNTEPTDAQKEAGNYKKGHLNLQGLDITLENPKGSVRSGTDADGKAWQSTMAHDYGYIKRTEGADGDHVDAFIGDNPESQNVYVVDQRNADGTFDEHKVMLGFDDEASARAGYLANYSKGWKGLGDVRAMTMDEFKGWLTIGDTTKPATQAKIGDFGNKLGGARKDLWGGYQDKLEGNSEDQIAKLPLSRSWPAPDYQGLIDAGMDARSVALMRAMREVVPTKPRTAYRVSSWAASVKSMRDLSVSLMNGELTPSQIEMAVARSSLRHSNQIGTKADLYEAVGHKVSLSDIELSQGRYSLHDGVTYNPPKTIWQISKQSNATAFSTWPRVLASGDSKAEVLSSFKSSYQSLLDNSRDKPRETSFDIYSSDRRKTWVIGKKIGRNYVDLAGPFDNVKDARGYRDAHQDELEEKLKKTKEIPRERRDINQPRVGEDMRGGMDVTPELFAEAFGFRGVEFGNWVEQKRRQKDLNDAYDALMDMAAVIGVSPKALSLNGELGLAFGARGNGGVSPAAAHYEPGKAVINLTKMNGAGSLGHEWWHAMDNYFTKMRKDDGYMTEARDVERSSRQGKYIHVGEVRRQMIDAFGAVKRSIDQTSIQARSAKLDSKRSKEYWGTLREMSARAFESYLIAKLQDQHASNDYLANIVSNEVWDVESALGVRLDESYPYPTAGEMAGIRAAFDHFFDTIQEKEVDGKRVLYSRNDSDTSGKKEKAATKSSTNGMTKKEVDLIAKGFVRQYKGAANILVTVVQTQEEASKLTFGGLPEGYKVHAFYQGDGIGRVVLVADNLTSAKHVLQKMRHEVLVHHGFQAVIGDAEYGRILRVLWAARDNKSLKPLWDHVQDVERDTPLEGQLEELLAYVAEKPRSAVGRFVDRIVGMVAQALRKVGFISKVTEAELRNIVEAIGDRMKAVSIYADKETDAEENRKNKNSNVLKGSMVKFSRARTAQDIALEKLNLGPRKDPIQTLKSHIDEMKSRPVSEWKRMADSWMRRMNAATFDALAPIKYAEDEIGNIEASDSAYIAARLATGSSSTMSGAMLYGVPEWKDGIVQMKKGTSEKDAFLGIFESVGSDLHSFLGWIAGNRAKRLKAEGRENLLSDQDIDALIAGSNGKEAKFEDARKRLMAMNDALLNMAEEAGLISKTDRQQWQDNDWYIPFYREDDDGDVMGPWTQRGLAGQRAMIKKLKGGKQNTNDLLENILVNASKLIDSSMKNMAMQKTVWNLAETDVIEVISKPNLMDMKAAMSPKGNKSLLSVKMEGEDYILRVHDDQLFKALTSIDQQRPDHPGLGMAKAAKRLLTATVTAMPDFMLRNFIRDAMQAWTIDRHGFKFGIDSLRGIQKTWKAEGGTLDMLFAGGSFMGGYMNDTESMAGNIRRTMRKKGMTPEQIAQYEGSIVTSAVEAKERLLGVWEKYRSIGDSIENANREAVYDAAMRAGKSKAEAIFEAKDLMDFSMMGNARLMMYLSDILPFFNARMQGLSKLGRSIRDNPKLIAQRGGAIALASVALALLNADDERYEELPDNEKDLYWHVFLGDEHIRIPKPFEIGVLFGTIPERMTRTFITGNDSGKKLADRILWGIGETLSMNPVPQVVKPGMEVFFNYDMFRAAPIESMSDLNVKPEARYNENTSETLRAVGEATGMSPKKMEHLVRGYFGTMGMWVMGVSDMVTRNVSSEYGDAPAWRQDDIAVVGSFFRGSAPAKSTQFMTEFYDVLQKAEQLNSTVRQYRREGRTEDANAIMGDPENLALLKQRKYLNNVQKHIRQLKAQIELVQRDRTMNADEKRERIDRMMSARNKLVSQAVRITEVAR